MIFVNLIVDASERPYDKHHETLRNIAHNMIKNNAAILNQFLLCTIDDNNKSSGSIVHDSATEWMYVIIAMCLFQQKKLTY